ncbi:zf-HC2 domain-containing protein [Bdellovibrionota bacterium FG-1]
MNCFEWHNRASDYLDGTLIGVLKREADEHIDACHECRERHKHYRIILTSIENQPRVPLPIPIRKSPFTAALPNLQLARLSRSKWEQIPWYLRTAIEGTSIVLLILMGISAGPKVRAIYEHRIEHNLNEFADALGTNNPGGAETAALNLPLSRGKVPANQEANRGKLPDEFASEGNEEDDSEAEGSGVSEEGEIRVGNAEIWRFNLKTDSPRELRVKVVEILIELKVKPNTSGMEGIEAPGGIQFDLIIPQSVVVPLKRHLQKMAPPTPEGLSGSPVGETFTWYKNKSKSPIPSGQTRVVIWLSQL